MSLKPARFPLPWLLALVYCLSGFGQARYFVSDAGGFPLSPLTAFPSIDQSDSPEFFLVVETPNPDIETRRLFQNREEIRRTIRERSGAGFEERMFERGELRVTTTYDSDGRMLAESRYVSANGLPVLAEQRQYLYEADRLVSVMAEDGEARNLGSLEYRYDALGRLAELRSTGSFGEATNGLLLGPIAPLAVWRQGEENRLRLERFDTQGRKMLAETREKGLITERESYRYDTSGRLASALYENMQDKLTRESEFAADGLPTLIIERRGKAEIARITRSYDEQRRLVRETRISTGIRIERLFLYREDGSLVAEELRENGTLTSITSVQEDGTRIQELYDEDKPFVRVTYRDGRKLLEEFLEDGRVVRTRSYR